MYISIISNEYIKIFLEGLEIGKLLNFIKIEPPPPQSYVHLARLVKAYQTILRSVNNTI